MAEFIEAVDARKTYRVGKVEVQALRGVSFAVRRGEFVSIVGPSGSGKSTLFYLLGGLTRADSGQLSIDGADFTRLSDADRTVMRRDARAIPIAPRAIPIAPPAVPTAASRRPPPERRWGSAPPAG